nr:Outer mitochondrial membrane transport complex protein domain containing protein [Haemonchus contortus]
MPGARLLKRDWEKDHVYLVQFPRAGCIPSPSPFALKVETWLRMADIPYTNISNEFTKMSSKGQIPFVEVNGRQVADSNFIIDHLIEEFNKKSIDDRLTPMEKSYARAYHALVEDSLRWVMMYQRGRDNKWFATEQGFIPHFNGIKKFAFKNIMCDQLRKKIMSQATAQGMGRNTPDEVVILAKKDLDAISMFLGNKKFFFGDRPATLDCTMFAHLVQFLYTPLVTPEIKTHMEQHNPNLVGFINRMKEMYWPDWDEATNTRSLSTRWKR